MKTAELLIERKVVRDKKLVSWSNAQMRRDYMRWKRIINLPTKVMRELLRTKEGELGGFTPKELKRLKQQRYREPYLAILHMRSLPFTEWTTQDINWMYRQLEFVERLRYRQGALKKDGEATDKLITLWAWGHLPAGQRPKNVDLEE